MFLILHQLQMFLDHGLYTNKHLAEFGLCAIVSQPLV